jgi:hypothetical protein
MDTLSVFISLIILLIVCFIGLINAETLLGVFVLFLLLSFVSYMNIYLFKIDNTT